MQPSSISVSEHSRLVSAPGRGLGAGRSASSSVGVILERASTVQMDQTSRAPRTFCGKTTVTPVVAQDPVICPTPCRFITHGSVL